MSIPYVSFDVEISTVVPEEGSWDDYRPLGISCASTFTNYGEERLWHGGPDINGEYPNRMTPGECQDLVAYLTDALSDGYRPLTWNGAGFDFRTLYEECVQADDDKEYWLVKCVRLALAHYDPGFQMVAEKGFMVGLKTAAEGLGVAGKTEGMSGALAPKMWAEGREAQDKVLEYVAQDVRATAVVFDALHEQRRLPWISRSGRENEWRPRILTTNAGARMLTVDEAWRMVYPDTSWMSNPRTRGQILEWTGQVQVPGRTVRQKRAGIEWRDVTKRVVLPPFTRGTFAGEQLDKEYCLVAFDEPVNQVLKVAREAVDL
jgi:hypothetical protein